MFLSCRKAGGSYIWTYGLKAVISVAHNRSFGAFLLFICFILVIPWFLLPVRSASSFRVRCWRLYRRGNAATLWARWKGTLRASRTTSQLCEEENWEAGRTNLGHFRPFCRKRTHTILYCSLISSVLLLFSRSAVSNFATPWIAAHQASLSFTNSRSLLRLMSIVLVMPSKHLILCRSLLLLPSIFPSIRVFSNELACCTRQLKYWSSSSSSFKEYSGLIFLKIDWFDLLSIQMTPKSFLYHNLKASSFWCSALFMIRLLHPYMTTGKIIALTRRTFVGKVMSLAV